METPDSATETPSSNTDNSSDQLLVLSRVSAAVSGLGNIDAVLRMGLDKTLEYMDGVAGGIMLLDEETRTLRYRVHRGLSERYVNEMHHSVDEGISGRVVQTGRAVLLDDITQEPGAAHRHLIDTEGLHAFISVPLRSRERVLGVMNCASRVPRVFSERDMHLLHSIGDQLGTAVEQANLYEALDRSRRNYWRVARRLIVAQEEERERIARDLHDETSQSLAGLTLKLQVLKELAEMLHIEDERFLDILAETHASAVNINREVGRLIADLRPTLLSTLGFAPALRQYAESNLEPAGINVSFNFEESKPRLRPNVEASLFRWAQGAIGNIIRHADASNVSISLRDRGDTVELRITDNGRGFSVNELNREGERGHGTGLLIMKERLQLVGGGCQIDSKPGRGTTVTARVPVSI